MTTLTKPKGGDTPGKERYVCGKEICVWVVLSGGLFKGISNVYSLEQLIGLVPMKYKIIHVQSSLLMKKYLH